MSESYSGLTWRARLPGVIDPLNSRYISSSSLAQSRRQISMMANPEFESLRHWSLYGQPGEAPIQKVTAEDRHSLKPFSQPESATWHQPIPEKGFLRLLLGFQPRAMEDKWFVYTEGPDAKGKGVMHMHRSWTGYESVAAEFALEMKNDEEMYADKAAFTRVTWEMDQSRLKGFDEEQAKETVREVLRWVMQIELP